MEWFLPVPKFNEKLLRTNGDYHLHGSSWFLKALSDAKTEHLLGAGRVRWMLARVNHAHRPIHSAVDPSTSRLGHELEPWGA